MTLAEVGRKAEESGSKYSLGALRRSLRLSTTVQHGAVITA